MAFWNGVKSAFGFGTDDEEEYDSDIPTYAPKPIQLEQQSSQGTSLRQEADALAETPSAEDMTSESSEETAESKANGNQADNSTQELTEINVIEDSALPADLFDAVIERFNSFQPDFVARCLNLDSERKYLLDSISDSLKARVAKAVTDSMPKDSEAELKQLRARVATLEAQTKTNEELRQENRRLRLSVERQKRSLLDRINDLEAQVARQFQEKEQYFASRHYSKCTLPATGPCDESDDTSSSETETLDSLRDKLQASRAEADNLKATLARAEEREKDLTAEIDAKEQEIKRESTMRQQLEVKTSMSDTMINALRNDLAANRKEYEETISEQQQALESINEQIQAFEQVKERMEARITELKDSLKKEKAINRQLSENTAEADEIMRLNSEVTTLNGRLSALTDENTRLIEQCSKYTEENSSLRHTIETNLYNQANSEMKLRNEIKELKSRLKDAEEKIPAETVDEPADNDKTDNGIDSVIRFDAMVETSAEDEQPKRRKRGRPKKVKIDDELDNTEWFASQKDNPDFGYHEPPRRPVNDDANQLTLF